MSSFSCFRVFVVALAATGPSSMLGLRHDAIHDVFLVLEHWCDRQRVVAGEDVVGPHLIDIDDRARLPENHEVALAQLVAPVDQECVATSHQSLFFHMNCSSRSHGGHEDPYWYWFSCPFVPSR